LARFINPAPQYKPYSKLFFFKSGTNSQLVTYKDQFETIPNDHPVSTDSAGRVPNIFFSGTAKLIVEDQNDVQYIERDPVGGEKELGDFTLWDSVVTYDLNDIVEGSDGEFYRSLANGNIGNDPTLTPTLWENIRFVGVWNENIIYKIGYVVQTSDGCLWKAVTATSGNNPTGDDGTNWLPAIDGSKVPEIETISTWGAPETSDFAGATNEARQVNASANTVDITLPTIVAGNVFTYHNMTVSTFKVQLLNVGATIKGPKGDIGAGVNMEIEPGQSVQLVAVSPTELSIVGAQV
jgi:hypothetical protein